uniref:Uncharacterized protein n=1 Tax=Arundo donax TaxID=35708 RepID=A0A0A9D0U5_ARUDO
MALATCSGVTCAFPRRRARLTACFTTAAASAVSDCCTVHPPVLISAAYIASYLPKTI